MNLGLILSRKTLGIVMLFVFASSLVGCAGSSKKKDAPAEEQAAEQKGSLSQTFTVLDERGRKAGTLIFQFGGDAILRDENGKVIGQFKAISSEPKPSGTQKAAEPSGDTSMPEASTDTEGTGAEKEE